MKLRELLEGIEILETNADPETEIGDLRYDSRRIEPGDLFVAVRGYEADGHGFIGAAAEKGAAAVLCEECVPRLAVPFVRVKSTRTALALASRNLFGAPGDRMKLVGVTGTNGKTTSTVLLKHVLEKTRGAKVGLIGTNRNMIGDIALHTERTTPGPYELQELLREMADAGCTHVVMEVSSHSLALHRVEGLCFEAGLFTNLTQDHLDFHVTMEQYAAAKALFFKQCRAAAVNLDDDWADFMRRAAPCPVVTYSTKKNEADLVAKDIRLSSSGVRFCALSTGVLERVYLGIPGSFSVYNALGVIACAMILGLGLPEIAAALESAQGVRGRVELVYDGDFTVLIDYAHTPDALENLLRSMKEVASGRLVVLFGCGGDRDRGKRPLMGAVAEKYADFSVVTSDNPRTEDPQEIINGILSGMSGKKSRYTMIADRREAIAWAIANHLPGDLLILAGKGHEDYQIVGHEKFPMDERALVAEALSRINPT
jgi:UDP-N-acetylmuramoyl-L-alanyl-D-glutamate--2,6-diaminopimelate ligase